MNSPDNSSSMPPPLPPPTGDVRPIEKSTQPSYAPVIGMALLSFAFLWLLSAYVPVKFILIVVFGIFLISGVFVMSRFQTFYKRCNGMISSSAELQTSLELIDLTMKGGFIGMLTLWPALALAVLRGSDGVLLYFGPIFILSSLWMSGVEKKFKAMRAVPEHPEWTQQFEAAVTQMKRPQFGLKAK